MVPSLLILPSIFIGDASTDDVSLIKSPIVLEEFKEPLEIFTYCFGKPKPSESITTTKLLFGTSLIPILDILSNL